MYLLRVSSSVGMIITKDFVKKVIYSTRNTGFYPLVMSPQRFSSEFVLIGGSRTPN